MSITIEGKEYEFVGVSELGVMSFKPIQQPTFSVGMRVECIKNRAEFIFGMVYRLLKNDNEFHDFRIIGYNGETYRFSLKEIEDYFTPYEKPKEGEWFWVIYPYDSIDRCYWNDDKFDNNLWNLGLALKTKEQAEFARERLNKLF